MPLNTMRDLYVEELKHLYDAENQIIQALPKMAQAASSPDLKTAFEEHLQQTRQQVQRLDQIFQRMGAPRSSAKCQGIAGILQEGEELMKLPADPDVRDAGMIASAQEVEHYEMAGYGSARTFAKLLGETDAARLLQQTLDEEGETDKRLTRLAERHVNKEAVGAAR